jgi:carbon-monoxide dehydrogenase small subunit
MDLELVVNGQRRALSVEPRTTLADALRDHLGLKGTHLGCEQGACGACTVLLDGEPVRSCLLFAVQCAGHHILTVEALGTPDELHPLQRAFHAKHALQCGFCTPGFLVLLAGAFEAARETGVLLDDDDLMNLVGANLCRCTGYLPILAAARQAASEIGVYASGAWEPSGDIGASRGAL